MELFFSQVNSRDYMEHFLAHQETLLRDLLSFGSDCCSHSYTNGRTSSHKNYWCAAQFNHFG